LSSFDSFQLIAVLIWLPELIIGEPFFVKAFFFHAQDFYLFLK
jgi:hypothetical protein